MTANRIRLAAGSLIITGADGKSRFNSDDGLFHSVVRISGSKSIPLVDVPQGSGGLDRTNDIALGTCPAACTDVFGWLQLTGFTQVKYVTQGISSASTGALNGVPISMMGGSCYIAHWDGHSVQGSSPDPNLGLYQVYFYTFRVSAGVVYLRQRVWVSNVTQGEMQYPAHTVSYNLAVGRYT